MARFQLVTGPNDNPVHLEGITDENGWLDLFEEDIFRAIDWITQHPNNQQHYLAMSRQNAIRVRGRDYHPKRVARLAIELRQGLDVRFLEGNRIKPNNSENAYRELQQGVEYISRPIRS